MTYKVVLNRMSKNQDIRLEFTKTSFSPTLTIAVCDGVFKNETVRKIQELKDSLHKIICETIYVLPSEVHAVARFCQENKDPYVNLVLDRDIYELRIYSTKQSFLDSVKKSLKTRLHTDQIISHLSHSMIPTSNSNSNDLSQSQNSFCNGNPLNSTFKTKEGLRISIENGSILNVNVDVIVNAANEDLIHGAGVAKHIADAAGKDLTDDSDFIAKKRGQLKVTDVVKTRAGLLPFKAVLHAVGPRWNQYKNKKDCLKDLRDTVKHVLKKAEKEMWMSLAMPSISAGIFGVPRELCAEMYVTAIYEFSQENRVSNLDIHIVDVDDTMFKIMKKEFEKMEYYGTAPNLYTVDVRYPQVTWFESASSLSASRHSSPDTKPLYSQVASSDPSHSYSGSKVSNIPHQRPSTAAYQTKPKSNWKKCANETIGGITANVYEHDNHLKVKIYTGSIVRFHGDAIVISADYTISGKGFLSEAVKQKGGIEYEKNFEDMKKKHKFYSIGDVLYCKKGGQIGADYVMHLVMNQLAVISPSTLSDYYTALKAVFEKANPCKIKKIAMPLIGAGFVEKTQTDLKKCCDTLFGAITNFCFQKGHNCYIEEVHFINKNWKVTHALWDNFDANSSAVGSLQGQRPQSGHTSNNHGGSFSITHKGQSRAAHGGHSDGSKDSQRHMKESQNWRDPKQPYRDRKSEQGLDKDKNVSDRHHKRKSADDYSVDFSKQGARPKEKNQFTRSISLPGESQEEEIDIETLLKISSAEEERPTVTGNLNIIENSDEEDSDDDTHKESYTSHDQEKPKCCLCKVDDVHSLTKLFSCSHVYCKSCLSSMNEHDTPCVLCASIKDKKPQKEPKEATKCVICLDDVTNGIKLKCGHEFCKDCLTQSFTQHKAACPVCGTIYGTIQGNQPEGKMTWETDSHSLPGYPRCGTITIKYVFPSGKQGPEHPNPGSPYEGTERKGFLPDNREGQKVLRLLKKAFDRKLTFTIGYSRTTGQENVVTWNDIHHKTKRDTGAQRFGYPDPTYLERVQEELAAKGITE